MQALSARDENPAAQGTGEPSQEAEVPECERG